MHRKSENQGLTNPQNDAIIISISIYQGDDVMRILLAEDERSLSRAICEILKKNN